MSTIAAPASALEAAAKAAGLTLVSDEPGTDFAGTPTTRAVVALASDQTKQLVLELSAAYDAADPKFTSGLATFFAEAAQRLRNPNPDCYLTLHGLPLSFGNFAWPFHGSTSGADTFIVHGDVHLADGTDSPLFAKISAAMTQTFATVVPSSVIVDACFHGVSGWMSSTTTNPSDVIWCTVSSSRAIAAGSNVVVLWSALTPAIRGTGLMLSRTWSNPRSCTNWKSAALV